MSNYKIRIELDVTPIEMAKIAQVLTGESFAPKEELKAEKPKAEKPKPPKEEKKADPKPEPKEEAEDAPDVSLNDIRAIMSKKVKEHREALKAELDKYGAKNVSVLDEEHYGAFYKFLTEL